MENTTQLRRSPEMNIRMDIKFDTKVTLILIFSVDSKSDWGVGIRNLSKRALALRNLGPCCLIGNLILSEKSSNLLSGKSILRVVRKRTWFVVWGKATAGCFMQTLKRTLGFQKQMQPVYVIGCTFWVISHVSPVWLSMNWVTAQTWHPVLVCV